MLKTLKKTAWTQNMQVKHKHDIREALLMSTDFLGLNARFFFSNFERKLPRISQKMHCVTSHA